jgi:HEAT repeat protein
MNQELGPMADREQISEWLRAVDLSKLACTAALDAGGGLSKVGGLWEKLAAAAEGMARMGLLGIVATAAEQDDVPEPLKDPKASPLRVLQGNSLEELLERLYEEDGPRAAVRRHYRETSASLELPGKKDSVFLETLYQELPLLREVERERLPRDFGSPDLAKHLRTDDESHPGLRAAEILRWEEQLRNEQVTYSRHGLEELFAHFCRVVPKAASGVPRFVLLGPPGSGKTTLEQVLAYKAATGALRFSGRRLLPVRVRLREWEAWAVKSSNPETSLPEYLAEYHKDLSPAARATQWRQWLRQGDVLLLLDGLDEIDGKREFLDALKVALGTFLNCPTVVTCRTVSAERYQSVCRGLPPFLLAGLADAQRDVYIRSYPRAHPDRYDPGKLIEQLDQLPAMRPLAANPLLLSILCFVVDDPQSEVALPATRGELYERAVDRMLCLPRRLPIEYPGGKPDLPPIRKRRMLERAALALFAGQERHARKLSFNVATLLDALECAAATEGLAAPTDVADVLLADLTQNSGLIRGENDREYFFLHLTIQEFLAASCLARIVNERDGWQATIALNGDRRTVREWVDKKAWDPAWREVLCLLAGRLDDAGPLLEMLNKREPTATNPTGDDAFRHRLALAAWCLVELRESQRLALPTLIDAITTEAVELVWRSYQEHTRQAFSHLERTFRALGQLNGRVNGTPLLDWVQVRLDQKEARQAAVDAVRAIGPAAAVPPIVHRLISLANERSYPHIDTGPAIAAMGNPQPMSQFLDWLAELLCHDEENALRIVSLIDGPAATSGVLNRVIALATSSSAKTRCAVARALGALSGTAVRPEILDAIAVLLTDDSLRVLRAAAHTAGRLGEAAARTDIVDRLAHLVITRPEPDFEQDPPGGILLAEWVQREAAHAVSQLGVGAMRPEVLQKLVEWLHDDGEEYGPRLAAAEALAHWMPHLAERWDIIDRLFDLLWDVPYVDDRPTYEVCTAALHALLRLKGTPAEWALIDRLALIVREGNWYRREAAVWAIGHFGSEAARPDIISEIVRIMGSVSTAPSAYRLRSAAARAVVRLGPVAARPDVRDALFGLMKHGFDSRETEQAAHALVELSGAWGGTHELLERLVELCARPSAIPVREFAAVTVMGALGPAAATGPALDSLGELLRHKSNYVLVQRGAADAVGRLGIAAATPTIIGCLGELMRQGSAREVRWSAGALEQLMGAGLRVFPTTQRTIPLWPRKRAGDWTARTAADLSR